ALLSCDGETSEARSLRRSASCNAVFFLLPEAGASLVSLPNRWTMPTRLLNRSQRSSPSGFSVFRIAGLVARQRFVYESKDPYFPRSRGALIADERFRRRAAEQI